LKRKPAFSTQRLRSLPLASGLNKAGKNCSYESEFTQCYCPLIPLPLQRLAYVAGDHFNNYNDVFPDTLLKYTDYPFTNQTYSMDIFGSGKYDLEFTARGAVSSGGNDSYIRVRSLRSNVFILLGRLDSVYAPGTQHWVVTKVAKPLAAGDTINLARAVWDSGTLYLTDHTGHDGGNKNVNDFVGGDKYIGLKEVVGDYNNGTTDVFGWVLIHCLKEDSCYVKESSGMRLINGITKLSGPSLNFYPNPCTEKLVIPDGETLSAIRLSDLCGRHISVSCARRGNELVIDTSPLLPGIYMADYTLKGVTGRMMIVRE
jgi:hypothetical protein